MSEPLRSFNRDREVQRQRRLLEKLSSPRLSMFLIASLTAGSGFLAAVVLLHVGVSAMWLRYPLATAVAYGVFLLLLWIWLHYRDNGDVDPGSGDYLPDGSSSSASAHCGDAATSAECSSDGGFDLNADVDGDILGVVIVALIALAALLFAAFSIVTIAPLLLAELAVDAALAAGLYRHVRNMDRQRHWLTTALARTLWRFGAVAVLAAAAGAAIQWLVPGADSIGDLFHR
jgi:hypothetical protein